jgi:GNAT superfamily N-acetyltransferase
MPNIRQLHADEAAAVTALAHQIWPHAFKDILTPVQIAYMLDWMYTPTTLAEQMNNGHLFYVLENESVDIGYMGIQPAYPFEDSLKIHKLYVLPSEQGKGFGKLFIEHAIAEAKIHKIKSITLNVNRFNNAVHFYKSLGFYIAKEEDIDIGHGYLMEDYVMKLDL